MRAWLLVCAALALAPGQPPAPATAAHPPADRLDHIKTQILAKLGLSSRPTPQRAPPRDVVRKILQRAADPAPAHSEPAPTMREIIAIAHRDSIRTRRTELVYKMAPREKSMDERHSSFVKRERSRKYADSTVQNNAKDTVAANPARGFYSFPSVIYP